MIDPIEATALLARTPAWLPTSREVLETLGEDLATLKSGPPALRVHLAEHLLAVGLADPARDLVPLVSDDGLDGARRDVVVRRIAARSSVGPLDEGPGDTPLRRIWQQVVRAELSLIHI